MIPKLTLRFWLALAVCCATAPALFAQRSSGSSSGSSGYGGYRGSSGGYSGGASSSSRGTSSSGSTRDYPNSTMIGDALITSDPETRRLIVITDEETHQHISQVISNLDRPKPQVLIKVVFAEVTYNNALDVGVEGAFIHNTGSFLGTVTNLGVGTNGSIVPTSLSQGPVNSVIGGNTSFGLAQSTGIMGGAFAQLTGQDYIVTLKAAAQKGKVEILSRPTILARNNQKASIVVGQEVPLITGVNYDSFGNQRNAITYQNVGIILEVTPFINPDGMVEMILKPQISSVDPNSTVQISGATTNSGAINAPVIDIRAADTVVVTPDGNTVVIGGLMQNNRASTITKVPLLGDIPLLGNLFKHKVTSDTKTELLIFLTPYVVETPQQLARMSTSETSRTQLAPQAFSEKELNQFLDNVQLKKKEDLKAADPKKQKHIDDSGSPKDRN